MTDTYNKTRNETATDLLHSYDTGDEGSLSQIITGDETRIHHVQPESKLQLKEWRHTHPPRKKNSKVRRQPEE